MSQKEEYKRLKLLRETRAKEYNEFTRGGIVSILQRLIGFLTDKPSDGISLYVSSAKSDSSYTNGKSITLGMPDMFYDLRYGVLDWGSILKALLAHESQHINSSSFKELEKIQEDYAAYMVPRGLSKATAMDVAKTMLNILEDGRIENIIVHKLPGFRIPLLLLNSEIRRMGGLDGAAKTPGQEYCDFHNQILSYTKTGRHLPNIAVYAGSRLETEFRAIQRYIDAAVVAVTAKDCANLCRKLLWQISDYILELLKSKEAQDKASEMTPSDEFTTDSECEYNPAPSPGSSGDSSEGSSSSDKKGRGDKDESADSENGNGGTPEPNDGEGSGSKKGEGDESKPGGEKSKGSKGGGDSSSSKDGKGEGRDKSSNGNRLPERLLTDRSEDWTDDFSETGPEGYLPLTITPEEMARLRQGVSDEMEMEDKELKPSASTRSMEKIEEMYAGERDRIFEESFPAVTTSPLPPEILNPARQLEKKLEKVLHQKHTEQRGRRHGALDVRSMYRSRLRDPHVFYKKGSPIKADMAAFILMDNSGSMASVGATIEDLMFSKSVLSRVAAAQIEYALRNLAALKISLFDVSCGKVRHATLKQFDEKTNGTRLYNSVNSVGVGCGNKDGYSIRVATKELSARRESLKVLLILSDGLPSDYNGGPRAGVEDVRNTVKEARRRGIIVIPIMFGDARFRAQSVEDFTYMYESFISCNPIDISEEFQKLFYNLVKKS